jgi:acyl-CoA thioester hydrolase
MDFTFNPRFNDTDALGHINNASYSTWFEEARRPVFKYFVPDLDPKKWSLILARVEIDYLAQGHYQKETTVKTWVEKIGNSSFVLAQEAYQDGVIVCRGKSFLVHFDYQTQKSVSIPEDIRKNLQSLLQ